MNIVTIERTASTNDDIKGMLPCESFTTVLSYRQSGGRGSKGREFVSPFGGAYFSFVFQPDKELLPLVTPLVAVAVRETVFEFFGVDCKIKWVNDLYFGGKKVCGILTETRTEGDVYTVIVGVGVNLYRAEEGYGRYADIAGFISEEKPDRERIKAFAVSAVERVKSLSEDLSFMEEYVKNSCVVGKRIRLTTADNIYDCTVQGINFDGSLRIITSEGIKDIRSGEIDFTKA